MKIEGPDPVEVAIKNIYLVWKKMDADKIQWMAFAVIILYFILFLYSDFFSLAENSLLNAIENAKIYSPINHIVCGKALSLGSVLPPDATCPYGYFEQPTFSISMRFITAIVSIIVFILLFISSQRKRVISNSD